MGGRRRLWLLIGGLAALAVVVVVAVVFATSRAGTPAVPAPDTTSAGSSDELEPVLVAKRDFSLKLTLDAETVESGSVPLRPHSGLQAQVDVAPGTVARGQLLGQLRVDPTSLAAADGAASNATRSQVGLLRAQAGPLRAAVSGELRSSSGGPVIQAPGIDVVASLSPIQALRFGSSRFTGRAVLETVVGQRLVPCDALWVQPANADSQDSGATVPLHCRVPGYVETVAGLRATLQITSPVIKDAVVVPTSALRYDRESDGYSVTVLANGTQKSVPVTVGLTDGVARVITSPLPVGAEIVFPDGGDSPDQLPSDPGGSTGPTGGTQPTPGTTAAP